MMVMCCISAFAQFENALTPVTDLSQLKDDAVYTIHSERTFLMYNDAFPDKLSTGNGTAVDQEGRNWNPFSPLQQFKIKLIEDKYYLYSVGINLYVKQDGTFGVDPVDEFKIMPAISAEYPWFLGIGSNFLNSQGAGQTPEGIVFNTWGSNQQAHEDAGNHYNIFEIDMNAFDPYDLAFQALANAYTSIDTELVTNLQEGKNIGTEPGNYVAEYVNAFLAMLEKVDAFMLAYEYEADGEGYKEICPTAEDVEKLTEDFLKAYNDVLNKKVPLAMTGIEPGYYTFNSPMYWYTRTTTNDTIYYTKEEADTLNTVNGKLEGEEGYIAAGDIKEVKSTTTDTPQPLKALWAKAAQDSNGNPTYGPYWGNQEQKAEYVWKIETVEGKPTEYRMTNVANGLTFSRFLPDNGWYAMSAVDTLTVCFDWRSDNDTTHYMGADGEVVKKAVTTFNIRMSTAKEDQKNYAHCGNHNNGTGKSGTIVGWADGGATRWFMTPIDEATLEEWMNGPAAQLEAMIKKGDSIAAAFPAQLEIAKDLDDKVVTDFNQFYSPYSTNDAQSIPAGKNVTYFLIDGNPNTYWHSRWEDGVVDMMKHYLQIDATKPLEGEYFIKMTRRGAAANDHPTKFVVVGYDTNDAALGVEDGVQIAELDMPLNSTSETIITDTFAISGSRYIRLYPAETGGSAQQNRGYWHAAELNIFDATPAKRYETTQYDARKAEADALEAAVAAWNEKEYSKDSLQLLEDETFAATYNALIAAAEAWGKVYVNPTALREAIAAAPAENLFVIGNNPGQWKEGVTTPASVAAAAAAYNAAGAYTPAESEAHIAAIAKAEEDVWAAANKIETGKWYRFSFPTEEMFDTYGWAKANIEATINKYDIETAPSLLGKTLAVGKTLTTYVPYINDQGNEDTVTVYSVETTEEWFNGDNLGFFEEEFTEGEDLFQFIQATDSSYIIQNKATGLFVRGGRPMTLSAIPSYFSSNQPLGAGGNAIAYTNVLGKAESAHVYMHAEQQTQLLTAWQDKSALKSMMMIEEVEAVNDVPTTEYTTKLWPGKVYTYTMPVDITVVEGATAYGAELSMEENDTCVVLKAIEAETIKAGTPFLMIANNEADYITTADRLKQIASEVLADAGQYGKNEQLQAQALLDGEYALVTMDHGMEVDTVVTELLGLRGTMKQVTIASGKCIVAKENGFAHNRTGETIAAHGAWIPTDFDPKSADVLSTLEIKIEGSVDTGISEVLDKVAKSGNIYNAAGQLVGKGNINTVNNLPAGIYIVNGVKVTKK